MYLKYTVVPSLVFLLNDFEEDERHMPYESLKSGFQIVTNIYHTITSNVIYGKIQQLYVK